MTQEVLTKLITEFGAMGLLSYCVIRVLRMAERITDAIVSAFQRQTDNIEALAGKIEALEDNIDSHVKRLAVRINEAQLALTANPPIRRER